MDLSYHLVNDLKRLRMPGMIETLDLRIKEATEGNFVSVNSFPYGACRAESRLYSTVVIPQASLRCRLPVVFRKDDT